MTWLQRNKHLLERIVELIEAGDFSSAAVALSAAFTWEKSPQGDDFWNRVHEALERAGEGASIPPTLQRGDSYCNPTTYTGDMKP